MSEEADQLVEAFDDAVVLVATTDVLDRAEFKSAHDKWSGTRHALLTYIERIERERDLVLAANRGLRLFDAESLETAKARIAALEAENAALRADAERYRWLRANAQWMYPSSEGSDQKHAYLTVTGYGDCFHDPRAGEIVDAAIDAARKP